MPEELLKLDYPWDEFLNEIDDSLSAPAKLICIGGFVVTKVHGFSRNTEDLDYIESLRELGAELQAIAGEGSPLHQKYGVCVDYVGIVSMPIDFEDRLTEAPLQFKKIKIFVPDVYDLILSKLERNSPKDYADVEFLAKKYRLSFATLRKRFDAELDFIPNQERHNTTLNVFWREWFQE